MQDRIFRQNNIPLHQITAMDRLAFIGDRGMGALSFLPESDYQPNDKDNKAPSNSEEKRMLLYFNFTLCAMKPCPSCENFI